VNEGLELENGTGGDALLTRAVESEALVMLILKDAWAMMVAADDLRKHKSVLIIPHQQREKNSRSNPLRPRVEHLHKCLKNPHSAQTFHLHPLLSSPISLRLSPEA